MTDQSLPEFHALFEAPGLPRFDLPEAVERAYGAFGLGPRAVYGNFVSSIDGIVAIPGVPRSSALISGSEPADRFVMALLRAVAEAIVIGAGTFRDHEGPWTPGNAYPEAADALVELRKKVGLDGQPTLVVVTASGDLGGSGSNLGDVVVITSPEGARRLGENAAAAAEVVEIDGQGSIDMGKVIAWLSERGYGRILTEGGPKLMGEGLKARVVDELFLTISPAIVGGGEEPRPTLAAGVDLLPEASSSGRLLSIRRSDSYLFLRYSLMDRHVEAAG